MGTIMEKIEKTDDEWKAELSDAQFHVLRQKGTERAFAGAYDSSKAKGAYLCAGCGLELFDSNEKFDSGTGWPSFWKASDDANVTEERDTEHGMIRTEVLCSRCGGHLGHVFPDGPAPTGRRYCINSVSLELKERES